MRLLPRWNGSHERAGSYADANTSPFLIGFLSQHAATAKIMVGRAALGQMLRCSGCAEHRAGLGQGLTSSPSSYHLNSVSAVPPIPDITATDRSTYASCQCTKSLPR